MIAAALFVIFPLCMAYAAFSDLLTMTIPNRVSLILVAAFLILALANGLAPAVLGSHLLGAIIVFAAGFALFATGTMGGGDAKLLAASALWFGFNAHLAMFLAVTGVFGGILAVAILMMRSDRGFYIMSRMPMSHNLINANIGVPYGIAIGAAGLVTYPDTPLMAALIASLT